MESIILSKISQTGQILYNLYVESENYNKLVNIARKKSDSQIQRTN